MQMTPGGRWFAPPFDAPPVYVAPKQVEAHAKRLYGDGWTPCEDPRGNQPQVATEPVQDAKEAASQARIDQLEAMVRQLLAAKSEQVNVPTSTNDGSAHSEDSHNDSGPRRNKPTVR